MKILRNIKVPTGNILVVQGENDYKTPRYVYKPKSTKTKQDVISNRLFGLKHFDSACEIVSKKEIIQRAIETARDPRYEGIWGKSNEWSQFDWAFGNTWRQIISPNADLSTSFNLDEALTPDEMIFVAKELGIEEEFTPVKKRCDNR
jgi:hypothetical protein